MLVGVAASLAAILAGSASASPTYCTYQTVGCEIPLQELLANDLPTDGSTFSGVNALVQGGDGASIQDFYSAMSDAGVMDPAEYVGGYETADGLTVFSGDVGIGGAGALDLGAGALAPETLGVSVVGAIAFQYGIRYLWGTFNPPPSAQLGTALWQQTIGLCDGYQGNPEGTYVPGWGPGDLNGSDSYYVLDWKGVDQSWSSDMSPRNVGCGIPDPAQVPAGTYAPQTMADLNAIWAAMNADAAETSCPQAAPSVVPTETIGGVQWYALAMTSAAYRGEISCTVQQLEPYPASPDFTTTVTAPDPAYVDFNRPRADISLDTGLGSFVDTQLQNGGATVPTTQPTFGPDGGWQYDPAVERVTYGPYVLPSGDDQARIECDDAGSGSGWTTVTPGSVVTLVRGGISTAGGNGAFLCYLDARPSTSTTTDPVQTEDPAVSPNPVELQDGTPVEIGPPPSGGSSCNCTFDFGPLRNLNFGSVFPFGVVGYLGGILGAMEVPGAAPSFNISVGHTFHVDMSSSSWETTYRPLVWPVMEFVIAVGAIVFIALRHFRRGTADV